MKITFIYTTFGIVAASLVSSALAALTNEEILASYHSYVDPSTKGPFSYELSKKTLLQNF
jgi:hypothetical protein